MCFRVKSWNDVLNCIQINRNKDVTSTWLGIEYEELLRSNRDTNNETMKQLVMQRTSLKIPLQTLYRVKRFALC